jgi:chorismate mutase/prephenate dehydrogenase
MEELEALRRRIHAIDAELLALAAERIGLARRVGEAKRREGRATVDYAQERVVLERARELARQRNLDPAVAEEILTTLIRASVSIQEADRLRHTAAGAGKTAVVVGGAGRMGRWLLRFLDAHGATVEILDPAAGPAESRRGEEAVARADLVFCATSPGVTAQLYRSWSAGPPQALPRGVIADIASIKSPLVEPIARLRRAGGRVASIHPMFGPATALLRERDVVVCDTGDASATEAVEALFRPTSARLVRLPLADHDRIMADLLSLAHASAIAFALALPETEHPVRSTTFQALERLSAEVVRESADVYFEIQADNPYSAAAVERLRQALEAVIAAAQARDPERFRQLLIQGQRRTPSPA